MQFIHYTLSERGGHGMIDAAVAANHAADLRAVPLGELTDARVDKFFDDNGIGKDLAGYKARIRIMNRCMNAIDDSENIQAMAHGTINHEQAYELTKEYLTNGRWRNYS